MAKYFGLAALAVLIGVMSLGCSGSDPVGSNPDNSGKAALSPATYASIGNFVWLDNNMNGLQDEGEPGIPNVTVHLFDCEDSLIASTLTDADGFYIFGGLWPGDYYVKFDLPAGYEFTLLGQGLNEELDSDANRTTGMADCTTLDAYEEDMSWDAGMYRSEPPQEGCTRTIGYWKTHAGFGPQEDAVTQLLPITLGSGGGKSLVVSTAQIAVDVLTMKTYGKNNNGITKLYAQLLGAKLSIAAGADDSDVASAISAANDFLHDYDWNDWDGLSGDDKDMVMDWQSMFDSYNNGYIGPGHCDEATIYNDDDGGLSKN
jgi:hypothetical protein